jgi:hypothetical protein
VADSRRDSHLDRLKKGLDTMAAKHKKRFKREYTQLNFFHKLIKYFFYLYSDIIHIIKYGQPFNEFGVTMYCGRQGAGKTISMVEYLERMRKKFPNVQIVTNFGYVHENKSMTSWQDFFDIRNGEDGVIFAIDEIQNEYNSNAWKTFPEGLLSEITQQRKQKVKIVCTSQVFSRVVKPLREQCFEVVECVTLFGRWSFMKSFDADEYNSVIDNPVLKRKLHRNWRKNFVQDAKIRELYNSYAKIERLAKVEAIPRAERVL